jgi:hypothetical protein
MDPHFRYLTEPTQAIPYHYKMILYHSQNMHSLKQVERWRQLKRRNIGNNIQVKRVTERAGIEKSLAGLKLPAVAVFLAEKHNKQGGARLSKQGVGIVIGRAVVDKKFRHL